MDLHVITGTTKGLGQALAEKLIQTGDSVAAIARRDTAQLPAPSRFFKYDLSHYEGVPELMKSVLGSFDLQRFRTLTLINNAGILQPLGPTEANPPHEITQNLVVNLIAPILLTHSFLHLTESLTSIRRVIVNITSGAADNPKPGWSAYSAAKAGLANYTRAVALENEMRRPVTIFNFNPGVMDTRMQDLIRATPESAFPDVERFRSLKIKGQLAEPTAVAQVLVDLIKSSPPPDRLTYNAREILGL